MVLLHLSKWAINSKKSFNVKDVLAAISTIKKLGIKVITKKNKCKIYGEELGYKYKKPNYKR